MQEKGAGPAAEGEKPGAKGGTEAKKERKTLQQGLESLQFIAMTSIFPSLFYFVYSKNKDRGRQTWKIMNSSLRIFVASNFCAAVHCLVELVSITVATLSGGEEENYQRIATISVFFALGASITLQIIVMKVVTIEGKVVPPGVAKAVFYDPGWRGGRKVLPPEGSRAY